MFVLLDETVTQLAMTAADIGLGHRLARRPGFAQQRRCILPRGLAVLSGRALRPLPPCRLAARRLGADIRFTWLRQTRIDADSWELAEIPLAKSSERYLFQLLRW